MVHILYTKLPPLPNDKVFEFHLCKLPEILRKRNSMFIRWQDRYANLFGKILLLDALAILGYENYCLSNLYYNEFGRPFFNTEVDFNISHSDEYVVCAVAHKITIGIDIEKIKDIELSNFSTTLNISQYLQIQASHEPFHLFFNYWAIKESVIKADGRGLSIPMEDIRISNGRVYYDEKEWYMNELKIDENYCAWLASDSREIVKLVYMDYFDQKMDEI